MAVLMWRRPLNRAISAASMHKGAWEGAQWDRHLNRGLDGRQVEGQDRLKGTI